MKIEDAIKTAIDLEVKIHDVYTDAMRKASDSAGKKVFGLLAKEESSHVFFLKEQLNRWVSEGRLSADDLLTAIPASEVIKDQVNKLKSKLDSKDRGEEIALLERARAMEIETSGFYQKMARDLPGEGGLFFSRFVEIEKGHLALVEAEIDALSGNGFWFDMPEFDLEKG